MSVNIPYTEHVGKLIFGCVPFPSIFATFGKPKKSCIEPTRSTESSEWWFREIHVGEILYLRPDSMAPKTHPGFKVKVNYRDYCRCRKSCTNGCGIYPSIYFQSYIGFGLNDGRCFFSCRHFGSTFWAHPFSMAAVAAATKRIMFLWTHGMKGMKERQVEAATNQLLVLSLHALKELCQKNSPPEAVCRVLCGINCVM